MNKSKHLISKYLGGELDPLSAARFEAEIDKDPALRQQLELYREVDEALADTEVMELRMQLQKLHTHKLPDPDFSPKKRFKKLARVAAAASLILAIGLSAVNLLWQNNTQSILKKYYVPYEMTATNRSSGSDTDRALRDALEKYQNQQYREAVVLFEKVLEANPNQMATQLYSGISNFEIAEYQKARTSFSKVIEHNDNLYIEQANWYLGFCYLKMGEKDKAVKQFTEISKSDSFYSDKAKSILKKLR